MGIIVLIIVGGGVIFLMSRSGKMQTQQQSSTPQTQSVTRTGSSPAMSENTVTLTQNGWSPATLTIKAGQTVTWVNKSGTKATVNSNPHPIHTDYQPLNLGSFPDGGTLSLIFPKAGTYGYHNHLNPSMTGTIVVQ